jgi:hypothetical protein
MSALDDKIRAVVDEAVAEAILKERRRTEKLMAEVLGLMKRQFDQKLERANDAADEASAGVRELFARKPDQHGIVRRQYFTPRDHGEGERHG